MDTGPDRKNAFDVLVERGFVKDLTDAEGLRAALAQPITVYCGYDATATSLHVGNLVSMMMLSWLQRYGHRPIALLGGGTTMVGDPSGKSEERPILSAEAIQQNVQGLRSQFARVIDFEAGALMLNNAEWLLRLGLIEFLRDIGSRFSVNQMLQHETYRDRLQHGGLSFLEFSYQLLQGYDYLHLHRTYGCRLQIGGSDQWANILAGADLVRRVEHVEAFALVCPLLTTSDGRKMGKSERGAVWLSAALTPPYDFYQYWINVDDRDVERFLGLFTYLPMEEVCRLGRLEGADLRAAKETLAYEVTAIVHGVAAAEEARAVSRALFAGDGDMDLVPTTDFPHSRLTGGVKAIDLLAELGLVRDGSKREARRIIEQGGASVNEERITSSDRLITAADLRDGNSMLLQVGKKTYRRVRAV